MGMVDAYGGAESSIDAQKRALLAAVAQQGAAGKAAYEAQAAAAAEAQKAAVEAANKRASTTQGSSAPQALVDRLGQSAADVAGLYHSDALVAGQHHAQEMDRIQSANGAYMDQARAAVPLARQLAAQRAAEQAAARSGDAEDQAWQREQRQWAREDRAAEVEDRNRKTAGVAVTPINQAAAAAGISSADLVSMTKNPTIQAIMSGVHKDLVDGRTPAEIWAEVSSTEAQVGHPYPKLRALLAKLYPQLGNGQPVTTRDAVMGGAGIGARSLIGSLFK